ncbi:MAG: hypothetical protein HY704_06160 [Gemmatimonadetes bacterium]|nr:hypothetical protein [Gemmatimonadota bacterium]
MRERSWHPIGAAAVFFLFAVALAYPVPAQGQSVAVTPSASAEREDKAAKLEREGAKLQGKSHRWGYAASLYRRAAELRQPGDPQAVHDLADAARFYYYVRDLRNAIEAMEQAAERALADGDVVRAAHLFVDAGWLAQRSRNPDRARSFVARARTLSESPLLSSNQRAEILKRIVTDGGLVSMRPKP